jgi:hypothetical protein
MAAPGIGAFGERALANQFWRRFRHAVHEGRIKALVWRCALRETPAVDERRRPSIVGVDLQSGYARRRAPHEHAAVSPAAPAKSMLARPVEITAAFDGR